MKKITKFFNIPQDENGSALPYVFGWLMGVPVTILLLIAMMRAIF
jgi:hypothetical protein